MMYLNYILALPTSDNNNVFYIVVIILVLISLLMFSLIYSQNRQIKETIKRKQNKIEEQTSNEPFNIYQETNISEEEPKEDRIEAQEILEEPKLIELTDMPIPDKLEYTQALWQNDFLDLESISKELETTQKDLKINMTPFEEEQEEKAIISYDELINRAEMTKDYNEPVISKVSLEENNRIDSKIDTESTDISYEHEESFLQDLKELKDSLI